MTCTASDRKVKPMRKNYEAPTVEVVKFQYSDQVVVASGSCSITNVHHGTRECQDGEPYYTK